MGFFTMKRKILLIISILTLLIPQTIMAYQLDQNSREDYDPLVNIEVTVEPITIRWLEEKLLSTKPLINNVNPLFRFLNQPQITPKPE
jgi:hypothetical protein